MTDDAAISERGKADFEARRRALEEELGEELTVDSLTASWNILQRRRGHRHSTDDLLTGWYALEMCEQLRQSTPTTALDLGTGIGTVGLLVLSGLPPEAKLTCIEAQAISYRFLLENIRGNALEARVEPMHGDLRDLALVDRKFPLVTGSPPYFDVKAGIVPSDSQKAHARFELRGDVRDYAKAATRHLAPMGLFVFCFPFAQKKRAIDAAHAESFSIVRSRDVIPREGLPALFSLFACQKEQAEEIEEPPFVVRHTDGRHTDSMHAVRARFGFAPQL